MGRTAADRLYTEEDLYGLPDDGYRYELQVGLLIAEPLPTPRHGRVMTTISNVLAEFVRGKGVGAVYTGDTGFVLARDPDTVRGPDVSFVSQERLASLTDETRAFPGAPDLAIEIVSPSNSTSEIHAKVADYLAAGARLVWVVDPETKVVTTYRSLLAPVRLAPDATLDGEDVLPGFSIPCARLFE